VVGKGRSYSSGTMERARKKVKCATMYASCCCVFILVDSRAGRPEGGGPLALLLVVGLLVAVVASSGVVVAVIMGHWIGRGGGRGGGGARDGEHLRWLARSLICAAARRGGGREREGRRGAGELRYAAINSAPAGLCLLGRWSARRVQSAERGREEEKDARRAARPLLLRWGRAVGMR
jgi:hypothetical protein